MNFKSLGVLIAVISATGSALANQAALVNQSSQPMTIKYVIARQNPGQAVQFSNPIEATVSGTTAISFDLDNYKYAGIVPISIDGHQLPPSVTTFNTAQRCSLTTDGDKPNGSLRFDADEHHVACGVSGGIF